MKAEHKNPLLRGLGVTLIELLVVVVIIGILATMATGVYTNQARRARISATHALIHDLEIAITRYEMDVGMLPPSGSSQDLPLPNDGSFGSRRDGSGMLHLALIHSLSGNAWKPGTGLWDGPYIQPQAGNVGAFQGAEVAGNIDFLDPWGHPILYIHFNDYEEVSNAFTGGTELFRNSVDGQNPDLPAPNPYIAQGETFYNTRTYQLISYGPNGRSLGVTIGSLGQIQYKGAGEDDINNFGY